MFSLRVFQTPAVCAVEAQSSRFFCLFFFSVGLCRTSSPWTRSPFFSPPKCIDLISCRLMQDGGTLVKTLCRPTLRRHKATWRVGKSEGEPRTRHGEVNKQGVRQPEDKAGCTIISTLLFFFFNTNLYLFASRRRSSQSVAPPPPSNRISAAP